MTYDPRFGLPLSLREALQADPSPEARDLAELLEDEAAAPATARRSRTWPGALAGAAAAMALVSGAQAGSATLEGRWVMAPEQSSFREEVTGPRPDAARLVVTRDTRERLTYRLVESLGGREVARGDYDVSFGSARSTGSVDGRRRAVRAERQADGEVVIRSEPSGPAQAVIHVRLTGPDTAVIEHAVEAPGRATTLERIALVRDPGAR